jgi:hypothetical protein
VRACRTSDPKHRVVRNEAGRSQNGSEHTAKGFKQAILLRGRLAEGWDSNPQRPSRAPAVFKTPALNHSATLPAGFDGRSHRGFQAGCVAENADWGQIKKQPRSHGRIGAALWLSEFLRRNETWFRSLLHLPWSQPWCNVSPAQRGADSRLMKRKPGLSPPGRRRQIRNRNSGGQDRIEGS